VMPESASCITKSTKQISHQLAFIQLQLFYIFTLLCLHSRHINQSARFALQRSTNQRRLVSTSRSSVNTTTYCSLFYYQPIYMITSIGAGFLSRLFFHFKSFLITSDWLEKSLDRKPDPIEVIM